MRASSSNSDTRAGSPAFGAAADREAGQGLEQPARSNEYRLTANSYESMAAFIAELSATQPPYILALTDTQLPGDRLRMVGTDFVFHVVRVATLQEFIATRGRLPHHPHHKHFYEVSTD